MTKHGPKFMEMRESYELKYIMMIYNFFQVVSNLLIGIYVSGKYQNIVEFLFSKGKFFRLQGLHFFFIKHKFNWACQEVNYGTDVYGMIELKLVYFYFLLKVMDLFDTVV